MSTQWTSPDVAIVPEVDLTKEIGKRGHGSDRANSMVYANRPVLIFIIHGAPNYILKLAS